VRYVLHTRTCSRANAASPRGDVAHRLFVLAGLLVVIDGTAMIAASPPGMGMADRGRSASVWRAHLLTAVLLPVVALDAPAGEQAG
jgi:hypothetical protein